MLELAEATKTLEAIEGKNEKERAAKLRLELTAEYEALHEAEDALAEARCALDGARLEWDLARYSLRVLEMSSQTVEVAASAGGYTFPFQRMSSRQTRRTVGYGSEAQGER